jgi:hypothetical protein
MKNFTEDGFFDNDYDIIKEYKDKQTEKRINKIMAKTELDYIIESLEKAIETKKSIQAYKLDKHALNCFLVQSYHSIIIDAVNRLKTIKTDL